MGSDGSKFLAVTRGCVDGGDNDLVPAYVESHPEAAWDDLTALGGLLVDGFNTEDELVPEDENHLE